MRESVAIIGGGIAGLSAAHELVERGFDVHVYERRALWGGKAASYRIAPASTSTEAPPRVAPRDPEARPGEHGFRFFPGWYRHLTDTMARIPYHRPTGGRCSVADNLVSVRSNLLAWFDRPSIALPMRLPRSMSDAAAVSQFLAEFGALGLTASEVALFGRKVLELVAMPDDRREQALEGITWWDYLECGEPGRSRAYRDLVRATTRTSVAAKAEEASAYTIGRLVVRTLLDTMSSVDRVLNGPTNEVWIDPWIQHLRARGVVFHGEMELQAVQVDSASRRVRGVVMEPVPIAHARRLRRLIARALGGDAAGAECAKDACQLADALDRSSWVDESLGQDVRAELRALLDGVRAYFDAGARTPPRAGRDHGRDDLTAFMRLASRIEAEHGALAVRDQGYFVLALPLEQLAYYVNRSTMLTFLAPELRRVERLARHMDWMAGIQFYLSAPLDVAAGHLVGLDSTWGLTAIEQTQFWKDVPLPDSVRAVLSVDISAWDKRGRFVRKEAYNCKNDEIAAEVWGQLEEMLNKSGRQPLLRPSMLVGGRLEAGTSYHIDDSLVDLRDRKKQAFYERARGLKFNAVHLVDQAKEDDPDAAPAGVLR